MKKISIFIVLLFFCSALWAQGDFVYPTIPQKGKKLADFVPEDWEITKFDIGDLNNDKTNDIAFVIEYQKNKSEDVYEVGNPRILVVVVQKNGEYQLSMQHNTFVLRSGEGGTMGDPFKDIYIRRGVLNINFTGGSNEVWYSYYKFRFQDNNWYLIGADNKDFNKNTGEYKKESINYLNGKMVIITGVEDTRNDETWSNIEKKPLKKLSEM